MASCGCFRWSENVCLYTQPIVFGVYIVQTKAIVLAQSTVTSVLLNM